MVEALIHIDQASPNVDTLWSGAAERKNFVRVGSAQRMCGNHWHSRSVSQNMVWISNVHSRISFSAHVQCGVLTTLLK